LIERNLHCLYIAGAGNQNRGQLDLVKCIWACTQNACWPAAATSCPAVARRPGAHVPSMHSGPDNDHLHHPEEQENIRVPKPTTDHLQCCSPTAIARTPVPAVDPHGGALSLTAKPGSLVPSELFTHCLQVCASSAGRASPPSTRPPQGQRR
jgi:hypothetical protein